MRNFTISNLFLSCLFILISYNAVAQPNANCQDITVSLNSSGTYSLSPSEVNNGSTGADLVLTVSPNSFNCTDIGPNTVTLTATDSNGVNQCMATVTVSPLEIELLPNCACNNDAEFNQLDGSYGSTVVVRNQAGALPSNLTITVESASGALNGTFNPIPTNTTLSFCNGSNCPPGVVSGEYYLSFFSLEGQNISMEVEENCSNTLLSFNNEQCSGYPSLPVMPTVFNDSLVCISSDLSLSADGGYFSRFGDPTLTPNLPAGFSQTGNTLTIVEDNVLNGPYQIFLHKRNINTVNGITDTCYSTSFRDISVLKSPVLNTFHFSCIEAGDSVYLSNLVTSFADDNGTYTVGGMIINGGVFTPPSSGCYTLQYDAGVCSFPTETVDFLVTQEPDPAFTISAMQPSPVCQDGGTVSISATRTSSGNTPMVTVTSSNPGLTGTVVGDISMGPVTINLPAPPAAGGVTYTICLTEFGTTPMACDTFPGAGFQPCESSTCRTYTIYNDGSACGANALFSSQCGLSTPPDLCPFDEKPNLALSCRWITINGPTLIETSVVGQEAVYSCQADSVCASYTLNLPGALGDAVASGPTIGSFPGMNVVCSILNWRLRISFKVFGKRFTLLDFKPFGSLGDGCNRTIGQIVLDALAALLGGDGGGGYVAADTRGIGVFDAIIETDFGVSDEEFCVPNRVKGAGYMTFRVAGGWPFSASGLCGDLVTDEILLLDILPIGVIPIIGPPVEDLIAAAGCNIDLAFSDANDVQIPIFDNTSPTFFNCQDEGYVFFTDNACVTPVDWPAPSAFETCKGETLEFQGITDAVDTSLYNGPPIPVFSVINSPGIYQTLGPVPGSELAPGTYSVVYRAVSCTGNYTECSFEVEVSIGEPVLVAPKDMTFNTDVSLATSIINGLAPTQGIGCLTTLNYSYTNPVSLTMVQTNTTTPGVHNIPDGNVFELGTTVITYTMTYDNNGNGVIEADEIQTETFSVTVVDDEPPVAECRDISVPLDNEGSATVYAEQNGNSLFIDGGSTDNADDSLTILVSRDGMNFSPSVDFNCDDVGTNNITLRVIDDAGNSSDCIAEVIVRNYFEDFELNLNFPEICLGPFQQTFDLSPYVSIELPNGNSIGHDQVGSLGDSIFGDFILLAFTPDDGISSDMGTVTADGIFTPGDANGFLRIGYGIAIAGQTEETIFGVEGCYKMISQVVRIETYDPSWMGGAICCDAGPVWLGGASGMAPAGMNTLSDIGGSYPQDSLGSWMGEGVSFMDPDGIPFSGDEFYQFEPIGLDGEYSLTYSVGTEACTYSHTEDIRVTCQPLQVSVSDITVCPATVVSEIEILTSFDDYDLEVTTQGMAAVGGVDLVNEPVENGRAVIPSFSSVAVSNQVFPIIVTTNQTNINGCGDTIMFTITVLDEDAPVFINCPRPNIVQNAETDLCDAYVTFSLPFIADNCDNDPNLFRIDNTGLNSGSRFPVGLTTLTWVAMDTVGNSDTCDIKIIVEDLQPPQVFCPSDSIFLLNDPGECGAVANDIDPLFDDNCLNNVAIIYKGYADTIGEIFNGLGSASGTFFPVGKNTLEYIAFDQPIFLITEILQNGDTSGMEIGNFGPASIDLSCATLRRTSGGNIEEFMVPQGVNIDAGEVYTHLFSPLASGVEATYELIFVNRVIDAVTINSGDLNGDNIIRVNAVDNNSPDDFMVTTDCTLGSFGEWNPELPMFDSNGGQAYLQSEAPNSDTCSFIVEVVDVEAPICAMHDSVTYNGNSASIALGSCITSTVAVAQGIVSDINIHDLLITISDVSALNVSLISPEGTQIILFSDLCAGQANVNVSLDDQVMESINDAACGPLGSGFIYQPQEAFKAFYGEQAEGDWTLEIYLDENISGTLDDWDLQVLFKEDYDQEDITVANDEGDCGALVTWTHPVFDDNCCEGTMTVTYDFENDVTGISHSLTDVILDPSIPVDLDGVEVTRYYEVGTTLVTYTLRDIYGNTSTCGFTVIVNDEEAPEFPNGCDDLVQNLDPGACYGTIDELPEITDNCEVDTVVLVYEDDGSFVDRRFVPIGVHTIYIIATDIYGNADTCAFVFEVIEFIPTSSTLSCNDHINLSLDENCEAVINADMILEGGPYRCYENYCIEITDAQGNPHINLFDLSDINQTFNVSVVDCMGSGNSCWGTVTIELKLLPVIQCPADTALRCNVDIHDLDVTGRLQLLSCAPSASIQYEDNIISQQTCGDTVQVIERVFSVTTITGNVSLCTQRIVLLGFDPSHIVFPDDITYLDPLPCGDVKNDPSLLEPDNTGWPTIDGKDILGNSGECRLFVSYTDEVHVSADCPTSYIVLRHWSIINECKPNRPGYNPIRHAQTIKVEDNLPPSLLDLVDVTIGTDVNNCSALTYTLPEIVDFDNCSEYDVEWRVQYGFINQGRIFGLQPGPNTVTAIATDSCGNRSQTSFIVNVIDNVEPVAICDQNTKVALASDGIARVNWETIDDGSYDNCGIDRIQIRRVERGDCDSVLSFDDLLWKDYEEFCCADIANSPIMIEMGIWDIEGNFNACMVEVTVEDKERPVIVQPANLTISCTYDFDIWYLTDPSDRTFGAIADFTRGEVQQTTDIFDRSLEVECKGVISGRDYDANPYPSYELLDGYVNDNCLIDTIEIRIRDERNNCGVGNLVREFIALDEYGNQIPVNPNNPFTKIEQVITFIDCDPFTVQDIIWPRQYDGLTPSTPILTCEDLANDSTSADPTPQGTGVPRFRGDTDDECAVIAVRYEDEIFDVVADACYKIFRHWEVIDWCTFDSDPDQPWTYTQVIKVKDTDAPILSACSDITICDSVATDCFGAVELTQTVADCTPDEFLHATLRIEPFNDDNNPNDDIVIDDLTVEDGEINWSGSLPFGTHHVTWLVEDMCGQVGTCEYLLTVADCKLPTPYCLNGIATVVMPSSGMIEIWANDFDAGSFDNCGDIVHFSFSSDTTEKGRVYTCDSLLNGESTTFEVEIWVTDNAGNQDFCRTYVIIQDNNDVCPDSNATIISGTIETTQNLGVSGVEVRLQNMNAPTPIVRSTDDQGQFLFTAQNGGNFELSAAKNDDVLNGVSTWDISLIQQHILGLNSITDPYLMIAANVNDDSRISGSDLIELRKVILGIEPGFPNNESWRFVDATEVLPSGELPSGYAEVIELMNVQNNRSDQDFTAVKIGDLNGSVEPNGLTSGVAETRNAALILTANDAVAEAGEELRLEITSDMFREVLGYQLTMSFAANSMEFVKAESGVLEIGTDNIGIFVDRAQLTMSWNDVIAQNVKAGEILFTLVFKATEDVRLSESVEINSSITKAEAYVDGEITQVDLRFTGHSLDFALYQNTPNPFESKTVIGFNLPEAGNAVLTMYDGMGKVLRVIKGDYAKGYNQISLDRNELSASGVVYYQLEAGDYSATKKMVVIE